MLVSLITGEPKVTPAAPTPADVPNVSKNKPQARFGLTQTKYRTVTGERGGAGRVRWACARAARVSLLKAPHPLACWPGCPPRDCCWLVGDYMHPRERALRRPCCDAAHARSACNRRLHHGRTLMRGMVSNQRASPSRLNLARAPNSAGKAVNYFINNAWDFQPPNNSMGYVSAPINHVLLNGEPHARRAAVWPTCLAHAWPPPATGGVLPPPPCQVCLGPSVPMRAAAPDKQPRRAVRGCGQAARFQPLSAADRGSLPCLPPSFLLLSCRPQVRHDLQLPGVGRQGQGG